MRLPLTSLLCGVLLSGCLAPGAARNLDKGAIQVSLTPGVHLATPSEEARDVRVLPRAGLGLRYGVAERLDLGGRVYAMGYPDIAVTGAALDARVGVVRSPTYDKGVDVTLAPVFSYTRYTTPDENLREYLAAELPVLVGFHLTKGLQLVVAPRGAYVLELRRSPARILVGASAGLSVAVTPWLRLVPEVTARTSLGEPLSPMFQANLGILIAGYGKR